MSKLFDSVATRRTVKIGAKGQWEPLGADTLVSVLHLTDDDYRKDKVRVYSIKTEPAGKDVNHFDQVKVTLSVCPDTRTGQPDQELATSTNVAQFKSDLIRRMQAIAERDYDATIAAHNEAYEKSHPKKAYTYALLRNIGDPTAWLTDRLVDDILIGKAAEFKTELPWDFDGRAYRALLFDRDIAVSYHIEDSLQHFGNGRTWVLTKYHEGTPKVIGKFATRDYFDLSGVDDAKRVALEDWNKNYANPSERSYLHLAKTNRAVLRAAVRNDWRGDNIIKAQMGPGNLPPLDDKPDEMGQADNGNQPGGTMGDSNRAPLMNEEIEGTGVIATRKAQAAPPAPPAEAAPAPETAPEAPAEAAPAPEAPADDGMSLLDALQNAQDALDQVKQKVDSGETVLHGQDVEPVEEAPQPGIQPQLNSPAGATPVMAKKTGQSNHGVYGPGNMTMTLLQTKNVCGCENKNCHPDCNCMNEADGTNITIYGTELCEECASKMPTKYMRLNQGVDMGPKRGQRQPPPLPGAPLPTDPAVEGEIADENIGQVQDENQLKELLAVYNTIQEQAKMLEKQLKDLKEQGKIMMVDHLAPMMRQLENQQTMLDDKIYKLVEWTQGSTSYGKAFDELILLGELSDAQKKLAAEIKEKYTTQSVRQEIRTEGPSKKKGDGNADMGDAKFLAALKDVLQAYSNVNAFIDTLGGEGMSMGGALELEEKTAVDEDAAEYYEDYYGPYGESLVEDKIATIFDMSIQARRALSDDEIVHCARVLLSRPTVHGSFLRYVASSTNPSMGEMLDMVFELSQSDGALSKELDRITIKQLLKTSDFLNRMSFEDQKQILLRAMRGDARFVNKIKKLYNKAVGIEEPKPVEAPTAPQPPVPQAGPEILTAALEITAAGMPTMTTPKVRKGEDDAVDVVKMEDAAKDYEGPTPGTIDFKIDKKDVEGNYLFMAISWEPDQVKVGGQGLELALKKFVQSIVSHRAPVNYGYSYTAVIKHLDPKKGQAVVQVKIAGKADAPLAVTSKPVSESK